MKKACSDAGLDLAAEVGEPSHGASQAITEKVGIAESRKMTTDYSRLAVEAD